MLSACTLKTQQGQQPETTPAVEAAKGQEIVLAQDQNYPADYEQEILDTIQTVRNQVTGDSVSYIFITDLHLDTSEETQKAIYRQLNAVVDVANHTDIDFVCVGGDLYNGRHAEENGKQTAMGIVESVAKVLERCNKPVFMLKGNHDDNSFSAQIDGNLLYRADYIINSSEWYSITMQHFSQYAQDYQNGYFYYDLPGKNARVICLNMSDSDDTVVDGEQNEMGMYFYGYKDKQIDWLLNKAMSREDCQYFIMCHDAFSYPAGYGEGSNRDTLREILGAAYTHTAYSGEQFQKDFSKWSGKLMLYHCGHIHMERCLFDEEMGGLPVLNTENAMYSAKKRIWLDEPGFFVETGRQIETASEALFDIVVSQGDTIRVIRFGAGEDHSYTVPN